MVLISLISERLRAFAAYRRYKAELTQLDDRSLADMGFSRGEIDFVARNAAKNA